MFHVKHSERSQINESKKICSWIKNTHTTVTILATSQFLDAQPKHITCKDACFIESTEEVKDLQIIDIITGVNSISIFVSQENINL